MMAWHSAQDQHRQARQQQRSLLFNRQLTTGQVTIIFLLSAWRRPSTERYFLALLLSLTALALLLIAS